VSAYPVTDDTGVVGPRLYAGINLTWLNTAIDQWRLGEKTVIYITDRKGIQIARPRSARRRSPIPDKLKPLLLATSSGAAEVREDGGLANLYGYVPQKPHCPADLACSLAATSSKSSPRSIDRIWLNCGGSRRAAVSGLFALIYVRPVPRSTGSRAC